MGRDTQSLIDAIGVITSGSGRGEDAAVLSNYYNALRGDHDADFVLVEEYLAEIEAIDTQQEFGEFVSTGGMGCFREMFTSKIVMNNDYTGSTSVYILPGSMPWYEDFGIVDDTEKLQTYERILDLYFSESPEKA